MFFEKLMPNGEFVPAVKKFRPLLVYINRNMDETPDLKAMKYCISALEVFLDEHMMTEKIAIFLKVFLTQKYSKIHLFVDHVRSGHSR